jgi:uncharacterized membrane protein YbhN (UPF0104 family)
MSGSNDSNLKIENPKLVAEKNRPTGWGPIGDAFKYTAVLAIVFCCLNVLRKKLAEFTWDEIVEGVMTVPPTQILLALVITAVNFVVLTGYDWIAVVYLRKSLPMRRIMVGAVVGYALSNLLGWILGGTSVRYRLYTRWGFSLVEVVAFVSVLSVTFWLGMFLLAGIAFVMLPVKFPQQYQDHLFFSPELFGYIFLGCVAAYLLATVFIRKPLRIGGQDFAFPPFRLSVLQLTVSAIDFALASLVLYVLLPPGTANYSTVLVSYLSAMIVTVVLHVPGGFGVLELIVIELLQKEGTDGNSAPLAVTCGVLLFRVIYHFIPGFLATLLFLREEYKTYRERRLQAQNVGQS